MTEILFARKTEVDAITAPANGAVRFDLTQGLNSGQKGTARANIGITGTLAPIFILAMGQSNMTQGGQAFASTPANLHIWNNLPDDDTSVGTTFIAPTPSVRYATSSWFAYEIALANPEREVYVLNVSFGSQHIGHWLSSTVTFDQTDEGVTWPNFYPRDNGAGAGTADKVLFTTTGGTIAAGLTDNTQYFVKTILSDHRFTLAATEGGTQINLTSNGTGTTTGVRKPDVYGNMKANITSAMAAAGVTQVDMLLWWQGENQRLATYPATSPLPYTYPSDWESLITRLKTETFFPNNTPILVFGLSPTSVVGGLSPAGVNDDLVNLMLQEAVRGDPDNRRFIYPSSLPGPKNGTYWDASGLHPTALGYTLYARQAARQYLGSTSQVALSNPLITAAGQSIQVIPRPSGRNLFIGGDFTVNPWQRGTSIAGAAGNTFFNADRMLWNATGAGAGGVTISQSADAPTIAQAGMATKHSYLVTVTANDTSLAAGEVYSIEQAIEGTFASFLGFGSTGALTVTISFWVKSSLPGIYYLSLANAGLTRSYNTAYIINSANTWEYKKIVINGDTSGGWNVDTNIGLRVRWALGVGSNFVFGPDIWGANNVYAGLNMVNWIKDNGATFRLALVQVEEGFNASPFEQVPFNQVVERAQRYYRKSFAIGTAPNQNVGSVTNAVFAESHVAAAEFGASVKFDSRMRAAPAAVTTYNPNAANANWRDTTNAADRTVTVLDISETGFNLVGAAGAAAARNYIHWAAIGDI